MWSSSGLIEVLKKFLDIHIQAHGANDIVGNNLLQYLALCEGAYKLFGYEIKIIAEHQCLLVQEI